MADASVFPTAGGVNPSLTIAALALRIGERLAAREGEAGTRRVRPLTARVAQLREGVMGRLNLVFLGCGESAAAHSRRLAR